MSGPSLSIASSAMRRGHRNSCQLGAGEADLSHKLGLASARARSQRPLAAGKRPIQAVRRSTIAWKQWPMHQYPCPGTGVGARGHPRGCPSLHDRLVGRDRLLGFAREAKGARMATPC